MQNLKMLLNQYSSAQNNKDNKDSRRVSSSHQHLGETEKITTVMVEKQLHLNDTACEELDKVDQLYFNVFRLQEATNENELITVASYILAKHNVFNKINLNFDTFMNFIKQIQHGYKRVSYHNKTHAADLCQVSHS